MNELDWIPRVGEVVPYSFLWAREREAGEESGRKMRPCVVVVAVRRVGANAWRIAVAPLTTQASPGRALVAMPRAVKQSLNLDAGASWVVCDEINQFEWPGFDLGRTPDGGSSYGLIPGALLRKIQAALLMARAGGALKLTDRD